MKKLKTLIAVTLAVFLLVSLMGSSAFATTIPTFTLSSSSSQLKYLLPQGTIFNGTISTSGDVRFFISEPNGTVIINLGIIDETSKFSFVAVQTGNYTLNFENDLPNPIQVTFSYETNPELSGNNSSGLPLNLTIIIIIAVVGSILIIFIGRRKNKNQTFVDENASSNSSLQPTDIYHMLV
jgi:hypothetical protein